MRILLIGYGSIGKRCYELLKNNHKEFKGPSMSSDFIINTKGIRG